MSLNAKLLRYGVWLACCYPLLSLASKIYHDALGANPVEAVERHFGLVTLILLCCTLSVTPLVQILRLPTLAILRRTLGLFSFFYACLHLLSYSWLDYSWDWQAIWQDMSKHRYVWIGMAAWLLMAALAASSNRWAMQGLKQDWKRLHRLIYLIALLAILHFVWLVKKDISEPMAYATVLLLLMLLRWSWLRQRLKKAIASHRPR